MVAPTAGIQLISRDLPHSPSLSLVTCGEPTGNPVAFLVSRLSTSGFPKKALFFSLTRTQMGKKTAPFLWLYVRIPPPVQLYNTAKCHFTFISLFFPFPSCFPFFSFVHCSKHKLLNCISFFERKK